MTMCDICGKELATDTHHLLGGIDRKHCDADGLTIVICRACHNRIHGDNTTLQLSKMLGQALWEKQYIEEHIDDIEPIVCARKEFNQRYGKNRL